MRIHLFNSIVGTEAERSIEIQQNLIRIGRAPDNDIRLDNPFVAQHVLLVYRKDGKWYAEALGLDSVQLGETVLKRNVPIDLKSSTTLRIFPYSLKIEITDGGAGRFSAERDEYELNQFVRKCHTQLLRVDETSVNNATTGSNAGLAKVSRAQCTQLEKYIDEIARDLGITKKRSVLRRAAGQSIRSEILNRHIIEESAKSANAIWEEGHHWSEMLSVVPDREQELDQTIAYIVQKLGIANLIDDNEKLDRLEAAFWDVWSAAVTKLYEPFQEYLALRYLKKAIKDIYFGYGPLEDLLRTPAVSEIMVVDRSHIYVERGGRLQDSGRHFISDEVSLSITERIVSRVGRRIDKTQPLVDARLNDGSRVNAIIPPLALDGPSITIRKFPERKLLIDDLVDSGSLTSTAAEFLKAAVLSRCNILISGGTGSGKTTLLNCLSDFIPDNERIVTIEDTAELQLKKEHVVRLETKPANVEGSGAYSIRDLVKNSLRMRPDRIVVGECRGAEALDMLQAMNTGHDGSLTTIHANESRDVILRLEVLVQMAADLPIVSIHRQIVSAIDLIVQLTRLKDGSRRVSQITEVVGYDEFEKCVQIKDLFRLDENDDAQLLAPTGSLPTFMDRLMSGNLIDIDAFYL